MESRKLHREKTKRKLSGTNGDVYKEIKNHIRKKKERNL